MNGVDLTRHFENMALAVFVAYRTLQNGETPVACVFVHEPSQRILSFGYNDTNRSLNGTRHAEFLGIDEILARNDIMGAPHDRITDLFQEIILYVTIEPCVMCALALEQVGIKKVYFGAANDRFGGNGTVIKAQGGRSYMSIGGVLRSEAITLLRNFYIQENDSAPVPKLKKNKDIEGKEFPENLDFPLYLSEIEFVKEFGEDRLAQFYYSPHPNKEITPITGIGYILSDFLTPESVSRIPNFEKLYPRPSCDVYLDLESLGNMLPTVSSSGVASMKPTKELK